MFSPHLLPAFTRWRATTTLAGHRCNALTARCAIALKLFLTFVLLQFYVSCQSVTFHRSSLLLLSKCIKMIVTSRYALGGMHGAIRNGYFLAVDAIKCAGKQRRYWRKRLSLAGLAYLQVHHSQKQHRYLIVSSQGQVLCKSSLDSAWQRMMKEALESEVITEEERFSLHGLKHLGITRSEDKRSGGHRSEAMRQYYDHALAVFDPPSQAEWNILNRR